MFYVNLVLTIVAMMTVVAVNSIAIVPIVVPVIRRTITIVSVWSVVPVRVIAISVSIGAITVARITNPNSYRNLRVRTLRWNESQSARHQCN